MDVFDVVRNLRMKNPGMTVIQAKKIYDGMSVEERENFLPATPEQEREYKVKTAANAAYTSFEAGKKNPVPLSDLAEEMCREYQITEEEIWAELYRLLHAYHVERAEYFSQMLKG